MSASMPPAPSRHLMLEGTYNVRDIGGYRTREGRTTRWRTLLRADSLHRVSPAAQAMLLEQGIRTVLDLRRADEHQLAPNVFADRPGVTYHQVSLLWDTPPARGVQPRPLPDIYRMLLDERQAQMRQALEALSTPTGLPAVVHCSAGKDRTGLVIALVLGLLDVPPETIIEDYALSAQYLAGPFVDELRQKAASRDIPWEWYQAQVTCYPALMQTTLHYLDEHYGGPQGYAQAIGLSPAACHQLRQVLLE
ncbi:MAG: tyrosine-protein phosphatase [Candidatus Tectimicrobiota bacterium]